MIAFFLSPLGRYVGIGLVITIALGGAYWKGDSNGASRIQGRWDAAVQAAIDRGEKARTDAESTVGDKPDGGLRRDKFDRDASPM